MIAINILSYAVKLIYNKAINSSPTRFELILSFILFLANEWIVNSIE